MKNGHYVSRISDFIIYSVEAETFDKVVSLYGPCKYLVTLQFLQSLMTYHFNQLATKVNSIVGGQTSCKAPEIAAFEKYIAPDVDIVTCHSLHGPKVATVGQPLVLINHRSTGDSFTFVRSLFREFGSREVYLSAEEHDRITADTQAVTHAAFLSMGVAWYSNNQYPWQIPKWIGGVENAKINISLRIYSNKWHVYAGVAISNPHAHPQILQYARSVTDLFKLMIEGKGDEMRKRLFNARDAIFGSLDSVQAQHRLLLPDELLERFSLSKIPPDGKRANSHLSLLAIVDSWYQLGINPYEHMICSTPLFRIWLGVTEYVFCTEGMLEESINAATSENSFRGDDLEFCLAARTWSDIVSHGDFKLYKSNFERTQAYFAPMFPEANKIGNEMISTILKKTEQ